MEKLLLFHLEPGIENNWGKKVNKEEVFAEDEDMRALPFRHQQDEESSEHSDDERGDGLVHPAVFLKEVTYYDASAEQRHEEVDGDHRGVIRRRQHQPLQTLVKLRQQAQLHGRRPPPPSSGPGTKEAKTKQTTKQIREWSGERWLRPPTTPWQMPRPADYFEEVRNIIFVRKCERRGEKEADLGAKTSRQMLRSPIKPREGFQSVIGMAFGGKSSRIPGCSPCSLSLSAQK